ncbi:hypothetical protein [Deinococcus misasensis]|uniref:hypothetical protein n=1 Tax=Deinococcus misasensis TaxID=392413 RepID=UPI00054EDB2C|nr:hypothetical protein [Deinococcus misasensis]
MRKVISSSSPSSIITKTANAANIRTKIVKVVVPKGATYLLANATPVRGQLMRGVHIILDLRDSANNKVSGSTIVSVAVKSQAAEFEKFLRSWPYTIWRDLSTSEQRNEDYIGTLVSQTDLNMDGIALLEGHELQIHAEGPDVIDWTKSTFEIAFEEMN